MHVDREEAERSLDREWKDTKESYTTLSGRYRTQLTKGVRAMGLLCKIYNREYYW